jgi:hypothetical protein
MKRALLPIFSQLCLLFGANAFSQAPPSTPAEPPSITLPVGTEIAIRTIDRIDSKTADLNREYAASLDDPVVVNGVTVAPANASAFLRVTDKQSSGFTRRASLSLSLVAVNINGQKVKVETGKVDSKSGSQAKRTATGAAVGAGTGAAIGAIAGGGLGAGIGAAAGGAAGTLGGVLMGKTVEIAPETRFTYTLTQPVVVNNQPTAAPQGDPQPAPAATQPAPANAPPAPIAPPAPPNERPAPLPPPVNTISEPDLIGVLYFQDPSGTLLSLEQNRGIPRRRASGNSHQTYWEMAGASSPVRLKSGQKMLFVIRLANGIDPTTFSLFPLETKNDNRRTESDPRNKTAPLTLIFNVTKIGESTYGLTPTKDLAAGEYAFSPKNSDDAYCFGVDQ